MELIIAFFVIWAVLRAIFPTVETVDRRYEDKLRREQHLWRQQQLRRPQYQPRQEVFPGWYHALGFLISPILLMLAGLIVLWKKTP